MTNLNTYVDRINKFARIFGKRQLTLDSAADRKQIAEGLEGDLSPENLTCDGELSASQVRQRAKFLNACIKELAAIK